VTAIAQAVIGDLRDQYAGFGAAYIELIYYPTYSRLDGLLAGISLALIKNFRPLWWTEITKWGNTLLFAGLSLTGTALYLFKDRWTSVTGASAYGTIVGFPLLALGLGMITASALSSNGILSRIKVPGAKLLATLAYSLYLTHKELIHLVDQLFPTLSQGNRYQWLGVFATLSIVVSSILYLCVERPFLILRNKGQISSR